MKRTVLPALLLSLFSLFPLLSIRPALAAEPYEAPVDAFQAALVRAMKAGSSLDFAGRSALLGPVLDASFDLPTIARAVIGRNGDKLDDATRRTLVDRLRQFAIASLAARFDEWQGEHFVQDAVRDMGDDTKDVRVRFESPHDDPVRLDYAVHRFSDGWRIVNVWFEGVSQSRIQHDEFAAYLRDGRAGALVQRLDDRIAKLAKK